MPCGNYHGDHHHYLNQHRYNHFSGNSDTYSDNHAAGPGVYNSHTRAHDARDTPRY